MTLCRYTATAKASGIVAALLGPPKATHVLADMELRLTHGGMLLTIPTCAMGGCALGSLLAFGINRLVGALWRRSVSVVEN